MSEYHEFDDSIEHNADPEVAADSHVDPEGSSQPAAEDSGDCDPNKDEHRNRSAEVLDLIAGVENQLEQMRNAQSACVDEIESIEDRKKNISQRENEIAELNSALDERESHLQERNDELEKVKQELSASRAEVTKQSEELSKRESTAEERAEDLKVRFAEFESNRSEYESAQSQLKADRQVLESEQESLDQDRARLASEMQQFQSRADVAESRCRELETEHATLTEQLESISANLKETDARASSAENAVQMIQAESLELSGKLEEAATVIERRDFELDEARTEVTAAQEVQAELHSALTARETELNELQDSFTLATERLQALASAVAEQAPRLEEGAAAAALCRQHESKIQSLADKLKEAQAQVTTLEQAGDGDGQFAAAREELERTRVELEDSIPLDEHQRVISSLEAQISAASDGHPAEDRALRAEFSKTSAELKALQAHAEGCESSMRTAEARLAALQERNEHLEQLYEAANEDMPEDAVRLREQAHRLSSFAVHLQRRRGRLREIRNVLRDRKNTGSGAFEAIEDDRQYKANQEDILRRRHELNDLESKMVRRWARHGTVSTVLRVAFLVVMVGVVSWLSVWWFMPGVISASARVRAQSVSGGVVDDTRATAWNDWHSTILKDKLFAEAVVSRLAASPAGFSGNVDSMQNTLKEQLQVDAVQPGLLQFRLYGTSRSDTVRQLESIVATLSAESQRQLPRRGDGARAEILASDGHLVSLDPVEVSGAQVQSAGLVFGGAVAAIGLLGAGIYSRLSRSRRIFDENVGFDEDEID